MTDMRPTPNDDVFMEQLTELFRQEGFRQFTIGDMAARLRCSRRRLYEVAESKEAIFCAAAAHHFNSGLAEGERVAREEQDLTVAMAAYLDVGVRAGHSVSPRWVRDIYDHDDTRALFDAYQKARAARLAQLIDKGVRKGVFRPCHGLVLAEAMLQTARRLREPDFLAQAGVTIEQAFREFYRVILDGLLIEGAAPPVAPASPRRSRP